MLDENKIKAFCNKYNYKYQIFHNNAVIMTGLDQWVISIDDKNRILLKHINKYNGRITKHNYHLQRYVKSLEYAFDTIKDHQEYNTVFNKTFRIKRVLEKLKLA